MEIYDVKQHSKVKFSYIGPTITRSKTPEMIKQIKMSIYVSRYTGIDQVKFFKGYLLQILRGPFSNTLTHICSL